MPSVLNKHDYPAVSTITKGLHMVPVLNKLGVNVAVYGNHDFGECVRESVLPRSAPVLSRSVIVGCTDSPQTLVSTSW